MRPIKFRVWCNDFNEWEKDLCYIAQDGVLVHQMRNRYYVPLKKESHIVEQYTGLKDKNGKEIYEGDIFIDTWRIKQVVEYRCSEGKEQKGQDGLENYMAAGFKLDFVPDQIEIIGNRHEGKDES